MVKLTMIARVTDGLPLAEGLDDGRDQKDLEFYKQQAKQLCKRLSQQKQGASRMSVETGPYFFQYPLSLSLSLCACSGSLHLGFVAFSACSQIFVWRVCLWGGASCSRGFIEFPTCWQIFFLKSLFVRWSLHLRFHCIGLCVDKALSGKLGLRFTSWHTFHSYLIEGGVCYLTLCDRSYPKKLAYQYLEELQREFEKVNRSQIETVARPYAFIKFGMAFFESFVSFSFDAFFCIYIDIYILVNELPPRVAVLIHIFSALCRRIYSENTEAIFGHTHTTESVEAQWWSVWSAADYDTQHSGGFGCWGSSWPYVLNQKIKSWFLHRWC